MEQVVTASTQTNTVVYAGFRRRYVAVFLDSLVVGVIGFVVSLILSLSLVYLKVDGTVISLINNLVNVVVTWVYVVGMTVKYGQTFGKKWLHIKIVSSSDNSSTPTWKILLLRESIGKFLSGIVFGLGYFWMIRDAHKQTWHDKIGKTVVVRV